jgi:hypothetical protein
VKCKGCGRERDTRFGYCFQCAGGSVKKKAAKVVTFKTKGGRKVTFKAKKSKGKKGKK